VSVPSHGLVCFRLAVQYTSLHCGSAVVPKLSHALFSILSSLLLRSVFLTLLSLSRDSPVVL
jgi:hypothetical protein